MRRGRGVPDFRFRRFYGQEFDSGNAKNIGKTLDRARADIFRTPFDALIPFQIRAQQGGDLFLRQSVPLAQLANSRGNKFK